VIGQLQSTHSKPGGTNCPDCDHSRPIVGQQQVFTAGTYLGRHSDAQGCFLASLKATTIGGSRPKGVLKAAQHFLPGRPRSCGEGLAAYALALEARAGTAILTNLCIVRFERWCFRAPNWMTASGHEETRRPRDPRDRSSSVTGPRWRRLERRPCQSSAPRTTSDYRPSATTLPTSSRSRRRSSPT